LVASARLMDTGRCTKEHASATAWSSAHVVEYAIRQSAESRGKGVPVKMRAVRLGDRAWSAMATIDRLRRLFGQAGGLAKMEPAARSVDSNSANPEKNAILSTSTLLAICCARSAIRIVTAEDRRGLRWNREPKD
jgi:hypothetical protein